MRLYHRDAYFVCAYLLILSPFSERIISSTAVTGLHILSAAAANGVDILVLGAFGCGAFRNDPYTVAAAYANVMREYRACFEHVEFAVFCWGAEITNYEAFSKAPGNSIV